MISKLVRISVTTMNSIVPENIKKNLETIVNYSKTITFYGGAKKLHNIDTEEFMEWIQECDSEHEFYHLNTNTHHYDYGSLQHEAEFILTELREKYVSKEKVLEVIYYNINFQINCLVKRLDDDMVNTYCSGRFDIEVYSHYFTHFNHLLRNIAALKILENAKEVVSFVI